MDILQQIEKAIHDAKMLDRPVGEARVSPLVWATLKRRFEQDVLMTEAATTLPPSVFGLKVVIGPEMPPGTWKLENPQ